jgi:5-amino-6-(5-phosphoribosylamino)uracil reductase
MTYVIASVAMSLDGYIDDATSERLLLSDAEDFDRVDEVRASVDAIMVGASAIRADDPRLLVRSDDRIADRQARGLSPYPKKITLTNSGDLDVDCRFFSTGDTEKIVYVPAGGNFPRLRDVATVVPLGPQIMAEDIVADLARRKVNRLLIEGGSAVHTMFFAADMVDEVHVVIAPFLVGQEKAPRFMNSAVFPHTPDRPMRLVETRTMGDLVLLKYLVDRDM